MRIYVDGEIPECCNDCEFGYFYDCQYCSLRPDLAREDIWVEKEKYCPLHSLTDYTKQVRKEVFERLNKTIEKYLCKKGKYRESLDISSTTKQVMKENLDQTQGK